MQSNLADSNLEKESNYVDFVKDVDSNLLGPCPWHFNCSIIDDGDGYLLAYRCSELQPHIRIIGMDHDLNILKNTDKRISFIGESPSIFFEDPRLFRIRGDLYLSYTSYRYNEFYCWVGVNKVEYDRQILPIFPRFRANSWIGGVEKNWQFFDYNGDMYFIYSINPHIVCKYNGSREPVIFHETKIDPLWKLGVKRGGCPPVKIDNQYYSFFHSRFDDDLGAKYYVGFYSFESKPPFRITKILPHPVFEGDSYNAHDKAVVFPCGSVYKNGKWIISYGYNDMYCKICVVDHQKMVDNMISPSHQRRVMKLKDRTVGVPCGWRFMNYYASSWAGLLKKEIF